MLKEDHSFSCMATTEQDEDGAWLQVSPKLGGVVAFFLLDGDVFRSVPLDHLMDNNKYEQGRAFRDTHWNRHIILGSTLSSTAAILLSSI